VEQPYILKRANFFSIESPLLKFSKNIASQSGEDGIIERIFEVIAPLNSFCVEFGAWDGRHLSNCYNLIKNKNWSGVFIEGNADKFISLVKNHGGNSKLKLINKFVEFSGQNSLDSILSDAGAPEAIDFLSIDIDGTDYFIWEGLVSTRPRVIVIEFNPTIPNDVIFVQSKNPRINQGCSLLALIMLGKSKGYELVCCTKFNAFFVLLEEFNKFQISSNSIWTMYKPLQDGRIWHGYDSYVYVDGMPSLGWSRQKTDLTNDDFQVLPESLRRFGDAQR